jgi:hypothetical protein
MRVFVRIAFCSIIVGVVAYYFFPHGVPTVTWTVFGSRQAYNDFMSARVVTAQRLHPASDDPENPWPKNPWHLASYRRDPAIPLSPEQAVRIKSLLSERSSYLWHSVGRVRQAKACAPNYGVVLTFQGHAPVQVALCYECSMFAIVYGSGDDPPRVNQEEDFDQIRRPLVAFAQSIFPNDTALQQLTQMRPNQAVQRTAGRSAFQLRVATNFSQQPRALSPAVADFVSR